MRLQRDQVRHAFDAKPPGPSGSTATRRRTHRWTPSSRTYRGPDRERPPPDSERRALTGRYRKAPTRAAPPPLPVGRGVGAAARLYGALAATSGESRSSTTRTSSSSASGHVGWSATPQRHMNSRRDRRRLRIVQKVCRVNFGETYTTQGRNVPRSHRLTDRRLLSAPGTTNRPTTRFRITLSPAAHRLHHQGGDDRPRPTASHAALGRLLDNDRPRIDDDLPSPIHPAKSQKSRSERYLVRHRSVWFDPRRAHHIPGLP
jgi:hypothetical protein